jgi:hypothetical protein
MVNIENVFKLCKTEEWIVNCERDKSYILNKVITIDTMRIANAIVIPTVDLQRESLMW